MTNNSSNPQTAPFGCRHHLAGGSTRFYDFTTPIPPVPFTLNLLYANPHSIKVGLILSTFASAQYVHLGLQSLRHHGIHIPVIVHDDASPEQDKLLNLCKTYNADFSTNTRRMGHQVGDVSAHVSGLLWAQNRGLDLVIKFSRRWIPKFNWLPDFLNLAVQTQAPTFSNFTRTYGFGFRTECLALHVPSWFSIPAPETMRQWIIAQRMPTIYAELCIDDLSQHIPRYPHFQQFITTQGGVKDARGLFQQRFNYAQWPLLGTDRHATPANVLWHNTNTPADYHAYSTALALPYTLQDFLAHNPYPVQQVDDHSTTPKPAITQFPTPGPRITFTPPSRLNATPGRSLTVPPPRTEPQA